MDTAFVLPIKPRDLERWKGLERSFYLYSLVIEQDVQRIQIQIIKEQVGHLSQGCQQVRMQTLGIKPRTFQLRVEHPNQYL